MEGKPQVGKDMKTSEMLLCSVDICSKKHSRSFLLLMIYTYNNPKCHGNSDLTPYFLKLSLHFTLCNNVNS